MSTTLAYAKYIVALAMLGVPPLAITAIAAINTGNPRIGIIGALVIGAGLVTLHVLALRSASRLGSAALPWALWATVTTGVWIAVAGVLSIGQHFLNVEAGIDDSGLIPLAAIAGVLGILALAASLALGAVIIIRLISARPETRSPQPAHL